MFGRKNAYFEREPRMWIFMRIEMIGKRSIGSKRQGSDKNNV